MVHPRVSRAVNPHRRKLSAAQIRAGFGGKRRQASLKASKKHTHKARAKSNPKSKRRATAKAKRHNPRTKTVYRTKYKTVTKKVYVKPKRKASAKRRKSSNPGPYLLTMSPVLGANPHKRRKTSMAKTKRKHASKARSGKRNPTRRRAPRRKGHQHSQRNPMGVSTSTVKGVVGAAVGFSIGKKVPPMLGASLNSSPIMSLVSTALTAAVVTWAARRFAPSYAEGALIGGGMAVLNVAWNAWAPASIAGYSALGDFVPGSFPLPQRPVHALAAARVMPAGGGTTAVNMGAFGRAW